MRKDPSSNFPAIQATAVKGTDCKRSPVPQVRLHHISPPLLQAKTAAKDGLGYESKPRRNETMNGLDGGRCSQHAAGKSLAFVYTQTSSHRLLSNMCVSDIIVLKRGIVFSFSSEHCRGVRSRQRIDAAWPKALIMLH